MQFPLPSLTYPISQKVVTPAEIHPPSPSDIWPSGQQGTEIVELK